MVTTPPRGSAIYFLPLKQVLLSAHEGEKAETLTRPQTSLQHDAQSEYPSP